MHRRATLPESVENVPRLWTGLAAGERHHDEHRPLRPGLDEGARDLEHAFGDLRVGTRIERELVDAVDERLETGRVVGDRSVADADGDQCDLRGAADPLHELEQAEPYRALPDHALLYRERQPHPSLGWFGLDDLPFLPAFLDDEVGGGHVGNR